MREGTRRSKTAPASRARRGERRSASGNAVMPGPVRRRAPSGGKARVERAANLGERCRPVAGGRLAEQARACVPRGVGALEHPAVFGHPHDEDPGGPAGGAGEMRDRRVHRDDEVEVCGERGAVGEVAKRLAPDVDAGGARGVLLARAKVGLQRMPLEPWVEERGERREGNAALTVALLVRVARPRETYARARTGAHP